MERIIRSNAVESSSQAGVCGIFISGCAVVVSAGALSKKHKGTEIAAVTNSESIIRNIGNYRSTSLQIVLDQHFDEWRLTRRCKQVETRRINKNKIFASATLSIPMLSQTLQTSLFRHLGTKIPTLFQSGVAKLKRQFWYVPINEIVSFLYTSDSDGVIQAEQGISEITTQYMSPALVANIPHPKMDFLQKKIKLKIKFDYPYPDYNIITTKVICRYLDTKSNEQNNQVFQAELALNSKNLTNFRNKNPTIKLKVGKTFTAKIVKSHKIFDMFLKSAK
jgi:hypothetical protein